MLLDLLTPSSVSFSVLGVFLPDQRLSPVWMKTINEERSVESTSVFTGRCGSVCPSEGQLLQDADKTEGMRGREDKAQQSSL